MRSTSQHGTVAIDWRRRRCENNPESRWGNLVVISSVAATGKKMDNKREYIDPAASRRE